ncbi:DUF1707 SHOCT-like domain-containing protein, partial [Nocardia sp. NPDC004722]
GATTLGELSQLTDDLQRAADAPADPAPPVSRREKWFTAGIAALSIAVAVGTFVAVDRPASSPAGPPAVDIGVIKPLVLPNPKLDTAEGIGYFVQAYRATFGDAVADEVVLFPEYGVVTRASQPNRKVVYDYRGGFAPGPQPPQTRSAQTPTVDLSTLNVPAVVALMTQAPALTKVPDGVVNYLDILGSATGPVVRIYVGNKANEGGYLDAAPDGRLVRTQAFGG